MNASSTTIGGALLGKERGQREGGEAPESAREDRAGNAWEPIFVIAASLVLAARLFLLAAQNAVNIFYNDQWDFNEATIFEKHSLWEMFRWQYGPPRLGLGPLVARLIEPYFRWNSRSEAFLATAIVTVAALCALYLKTRLWGPLRFFDLAIPLIFLTPAQYDSLWITTDLAHGPLPLLLLVLYGLALTCERPAARYALVLLVNFAAIYTGFGLFAGYLTPVWLLADCIWHREDRGSAAWGWVALGISLASLASFYAGYRMDPAAACFSAEPRSLASDLNFSGLMLAHFFGFRKARPLASFAGGVLLAALVLVLVMMGKRFWEAKSYAARELVPAMLAGYGLIFCLATAYGRSCYGAYVAFSGRYTEYVAVGVLGLYFYLLKDFFNFLRGRGTAARTVLPGVLLLALLIGAAPVFPWDRDAMRYYHDAKTEWRKCYLNTEDIAGCDEAAHFAIYAPAERTHLKEKLEYLKRTGLNLYSDSSHSSDSPEASVPTTGRP